MSKLAEAPRIDPRIKAVMGAMPAASQGDAESREQILAEANSEAAQAARQGMDAFMALCDNEDVAPSTGLDISTHEFTSAPDGNTIQVQLIRPQSDEALPCAYYIHGHARSGWPHACDAPIPSLTDFSTSPTLRAR